MSGLRGGALEPAHPSRGPDPAYPFLGLSLSTAASTRTRTGVLCRHRVTLSLSDP